MLNRLSINTLNEWQTSWNSSKGSKLHRIKSTIGKTNQLIEASEKKLFLARMQISHTLLSGVTHSYLPLGEVLVEVHHLINVEIHLNQSCSS